MDERRKEDVHQKLSEKARVPAIPVSDVRSIYRDDENVRGCSDQRGERKRGYRKH
jgi:hypothetical protein